MAAIKLEIDTSQVDGMAEFLAASGELDALFGMTVEPRPGALTAAIARWRSAMRAVKGDAEVRCGGRHVATLHIEVQP